MYRNMYRENKKCLCLVFDSSLYIEDYIN